MHAQHSHGEFEKLIRVVVKDGIEYLQKICGEDADIYYEEILKPKA